MSGELERFDPAQQRGRIAYEHLHRYALCREHVAGKRVLDLACGTGYGTAILGSSGADVTGLDISAAAIASARRRHGRDNVKFVIGDCYDLPFDPGSFDVVVANEMIEHVADHDGLLKEARRVLVPGGLLLVSTPNKPVYNRFKRPNDFHISELELAEFQRLLDRHFRHVRLTGTRMALLSVGYPLDPATAGNLDAARIHIGSVASDGQPAMATGELQMDDPEYVLAACSDEPIEALPLPSSLFFNPADDLWLEHERIMAWASGLHEEDEILRADVIRTRAELAQERDRLAAVRAEQDVQLQALADLRQANAELGETLRRERNADRRDGEGQRALLSRLMSQTSGASVGEDEASIVAGLFALNTTLVEERMRREMAEQTAAQQADAAAAARDAAERAEAARAEAAARQTEAQAELLMKQAALAAAHRDHETAQAALAAARGEREVTLAELEATRRERAAIQAALEAARSERDATQAALDAAERERDATQAALAAAEAEREATLAALATTQGEHEATQAALKAAEREQDATLTALEALQAELAAARRDNETAQAALEARAQDQATAEATLAERDAALEQARQQLAAQAAEIARLQQALAAARQAAQLAARPAPAVKVAQPAARASAAARAPASPATRPDPHSARRQRLAQLHQRVAGELASAHGRVAGQIGPPPPPPQRSLIQSVLGRPVPVRTQIFLGDWLERQQAGTGTTSLRAYLADPALHALDPHPLFAASAYRERYPDVAADGMAPLLHYIRHGWREGRSPHPLFPNDWYLAQNPDVAADGSMNPLDHYLRHGWREGRWPNPLFDPRAYLDRYPDVAAADIEPLTHFLMYGQDEGREPPLRGWDPEWAGLIDAGSAAGTMRHLLTTPPPVGAAAAPVAATSTSWPPRPLDDFWPAQMMRDVILDGYGEAVLNRSWYLLSLMQRWQDRQGEFAASDDCRQLLTRLRERSALRTLPAGRTPDASIIIPVYNNILDTLICLSSLLELDEAHDFEVIVADDGSSDATAALVGAIGGAVRHLRQPQNLGFLGNCNAAAVQASGRHIVLLNNDTLVFPGWLDGLLAPFAAFERVGFVGSKLINWDGTLQEAGGIFWRDGSAWNFGRNQDPRAPEFNYLKDVDYCSGASIAVPAALWREVGGFDPAYTPAYCEDSDLAFRLREAGWRTLYNPASEVVHHEGRSHGRDLSSGIKAYQVTNNQRFFERWHPVLERDHYPNAHNVLRARDRSFAKRHVLVVDHYVPQWDKDAGSRTLYQYMKTLLEQGFSITFWPDNLWRDPHYTPILQQLGVEIIFGKKYLGAFGTFMQERADLYDLVLLSRPDVAVKYIDDIRQHSEARVIYYGHDLHYRRMQAGAAVGQSVSAADVESMRQLEMKVCSNCDVILYPDPEEVAIMRDLVGGERMFIANPVFLFGTGEIAASRARLHDIRKPAQGCLLFVGGFRHDPNRQGIIWFVGEVLPLIRQGWPDVMLDIVGSNAPADVVALAGDNVRLLGFVSDAELADCYAHADVAVAPLQFGAGVKGKVIEAMANAVPVATTGIGAQGITDPAQRMFVGDTAAGLAAAVVAALSDRDDAARRATAALDFVAEYYSEATISTLFKRLADD